MLGHRTACEKREEDRRIDRAIMLLFQEHVMSDAWVDEANGGARERMPHSHDSYDEGAI